MEKAMKKGVKKVQAKERTVFDDEEQRRYNFVHASFTLLIFGHWFSPGNLFLWKYATPAII